MIKLRKMRWTGHVTQIGKKWNMYKLLVGWQRERDQYVGGRIILS
jgi:hypothetical protein